MGKKISQLTAATQIVNGDVIPIVQSGTNKRLNFANLKASLADASASLSGTTWDIGTYPLREMSLSGNVALTTTNATNGKSRGILLVTPNGHTLSINGTNVPLGSGDTWVNVIVKANGSLSIVTEDAITASAGTGGTGGGGGGLTQLSTPTLTATVISDTEIDLSWTNVANESSYKLEWSPNGSTSWTQIGGTIAANTTSYNHTGLTASTHYYYRITAVGDGTTYSNSNYGTDDDTTSASGGGSYDTDAQAIIDAKTTAGASWNTTKKDGVDAFVTGLKSASLWSKFVQMGNLTDGTFAKNKINWKSPGTKDLVSSNGTITYGTTGATGDGATGYIDTGVIPSSDFADHFQGISFYCRTTGSTTNAFDMGCLLASPNTAVDISAYYTGVMLATIDAIGTSGATDSRGLFSANRTSDVSMKAYKDGSQVGSEQTTNGPAATMPTNAIYLLAVNNTSAAGYFSNREMSFWAIHSGLTATEAATFNTLFQSLKTAFGF